MPDYAPLFTFVVEHGFYDDGIPPGLNFVPTNRTAGYIKNCGLLIKSIAGGIMVLQDNKDRDALHFYAADKEEPLEFIFKVYAEDVSFKSKTDASIDADDAILFFNNHKKGGVIDGRAQLHDLDYVSMIDLAKLDSSQLMDVLDHRERRLPPLFVVNIQLKEEDLVSIDQNGRVPLKSYYIRLKERQVFWKYYLIGDMAREGLFLVDIDRKAEFISSGKELLDGQRDAIAFRTTQRLPLKANSKYRFQLKEKNGGSEKVIIKRLPVADVTRFGRAEINGRNEVISEIYINC